MLFFFNNILKRKNKSKSNNKRMAVSTSPVKILLDLEIDLDNLSSDEDYLSVLIEATNMLIISNPRDGRIKILQDEIRSVRAERRKSASPKIKTKRKTIKAANLLGRGVNKQPQKLLTASKISSQSKVKESFALSKTLNIIIKKLDSIESVLVEKSKLDKKTNETNRKVIENLSREDKENRLEKVTGFITGTAKKVIQPVQSVLGRIFNFIKTLILGKIFINLLNWFSNPRNQKKVDSLIKFFSTNWGKLLSAYLVFGTGLGRFVQFLTRTLISGAIKLTALTAKLLAAKGVKGARGFARAFSGGRGNKLARGLQVIGTTGAVLGMGGMFQGMDEGGSVTSQTGEKINTGTPDTQLTALQPGEFVMSKGAVQKFGVDALQSMNAMGGGSGIPKMMGNIQLANKGGLVGKSGKGMRDLPPGPNGEILRVSSNVRDFNKDHFGTTGYRLGQRNPPTLFSGRTDFVDKTSLKFNTKEDKFSGLKNFLFNRDYENFKVDDSEIGLTKITENVRKTIGGETFTSSKTYRQESASIGIPDLIEHQDQLLKQIHRIKGFENISIGDVINGRTGMTQDQLLPILRKSDAQKATLEKQAAASEIDRKAMGLKRGEGYSYFQTNFNEGGLVGGGLGGLRIMDMVLRGVQGMKGLSSIFMSKKSDDKDLTDEEINELYKDVTNPKDPNILEKLLKSKGPFRDLDPRTTKLKGKKGKPKEFNKGGFVDALGKGANMAMIAMDIAALAGLLFPEPTTSALGAARLAMRFGGRGLGLARGARVGATGLKSGGFKALRGAKNLHTGSGGLLSPFGRGVYSAPNVGRVGSSALRPGTGAARYTKFGSNPLKSGSDIGGGVVGSIVPGGARRIGGIEPQSVVNPKMFQKGQKLFQKLQRGAYGKSATANRLRSQASMSGFKAGQSNIPIQNIPKFAEGGSIGSMNPTSNLIDIKPPMGGGIQVIVNEPTREVINQTGSSPTYGKRERPVAGFSRSFDKIETLGIA